jgi:mono/diheme cytochrome c family protein
MNRSLTKVALLLIALLCAPLAQSSSRTKLKFAAAAQPQADARAVYAKACTRCHGDDGRAQTKKGQQLRATDFTTSRWQKSITDAKGIRLITTGHEEMPAFKDTLTAEEIRAVMAYLRGFKRD